MPQRWHCEKGHQLGLLDKPPRSCPECGSRKISGDKATAIAAVSAADNGDNVEATLQRPPSAVHNASQGSVPPKPQAVVSAGSLDQTLAPPISNKSAGKAAPTSAQPAAPTADRDDTVLQPPSRAQLPDSHDTAKKAGDATDQQVDPDATLAKAASGKPEETGGKGRSRPIAGTPNEDEYEIIQVLGRGGMGVVYKARQVQLNRIVALKMILAGAHASADDMHRFESEAKAVAQLQHPHIVQIFDVGRREDRPFFALEFVEGGSLLDKLNGVPLAPRAAAEMTRVLALAIHFAHEKNIIHRDLKPANVLLTKDGVPKITDFGLAKQLTGDNSQTHTGTVLGTPSYMSPEQAQGHTKDIGPASDLYSVGAIFYEMLTGRPPFRGQSVMETLLQVQETDPVPPRRLQPGIPADLETICLRCLRKEPNKRYETAQALAEDLQRFLNNEPIRARPVGMGERLVKWARRRPAVAGLLLLMAVIITGAFFGMMTLWLQAADSLQAETIAKKNAVEAQDEAVKKKKEAEEAEAKVRESYTQLRHHAYIGGMDLAQRALKDGYQKQALKILADLHKPGDSDLRGFEWFFLNRLCHNEESNLTGHVERIVRLTLSPDVRLLATASLDQIIKVWDVQTEKELFPGGLKGHANPVRSLAFNAAGTLLASGGSDGLVYLWSVNRQQKQGKLLAFFPAHARAVLGLAFSPDGDQLATAGEDSTAKVWKIDSVVGQAIQPNASPAGGPKEIILEKTLKGHKYAVTCVAFGPTPNRLASGSEDKKVILWDLGQGEPLRTFEGHSHWVSCLAFNPDGKQLASGGWDRTVRLWDTTGSKPPKLLKEYKRPVQAVAFNPAGDKLAWMNMAGTVKVWDLIKDKQAQVLESTSGLMRTVSFSDDGQSLASISFLNQSFDSSLPFKDHTSVVTGLLLLPGDKQVVSTSSSFDQTHGTTQGEFLIWDLPESKTNTAPKVDKRWHKQNGLIRGLALSGDGKLLAAGNEDQTVIVLNRATGEEVALFTGHTERVLTVAFSPHEHLLASADEDGWIRLWDVEEKRELKAWKGHQGAVRQVAFSPNGKVLASAGDDRKVHLWEMPGAATQAKNDSAADAEPIRSFTNHAAAVLCVLFSPDGKLLLSGGEDQKIAIIFLETGKLVAELKGHNDSVTCLAYSPDGKRLASGSLDHSIKLWDTITGQEVFTLYGHTEGVTAVAFHPGGNLLLSASLDRTVRIWDGRE